MHVPADAVRPNAPAPSNRSRRIDEDAAMRRHPAVTLLVVCAWILGGLWTDQHLDNTGQLALGIFTAGVLAGLLALQPASVRCQTLAVVGIATFGEMIGSIVWGVYTYRLENLPAFVPPGHGLVYLGGLSLAALSSRRPRLLLGAAIVGSATWALLGLTVLPATDVSGAMGCTFLVLVLLRTRRSVYAGVFVVVAVLEIYGTALGTWSWSGIVPGLGIPQGNPPSGAASGYVVFDVLALSLVAALAAAGSTLQSRKKRSDSGTTGEPAWISPRASSTLPQTSQSRTPRALASSST